MTRPLILGIDPGLSGAFALVGTDGALHLVDDLPTMGSGARAVLNTGELAEILRPLTINLAVIELVGAMPKQGVSSVWKFAYAAGQARGVVDALGIPLMWTTPQAWKKSLRLSADKEAARALAIEAWPEQRAAFKRKSDHGRAEAALIARYGVPYAISGLTERAA